LRTALDNARETAFSPPQTIASFAAISPSGTRKLNEIGKVDLGNGLNLIKSNIFGGVRIACFLSVFLFSGNAHAAPFETFSGSASCDGDAVIFSIFIVRHGPLSMTDFDDPCRSGSGRCNDSYQWEFDHSERADGTAHITRQSSSAGFETINYDLQGIAADIPPPGWNRQQKMRHRYMFSAVDQDPQTDAFTETELVLRRYTDIHNGEEVVLLSLAGHPCADTEAIYRRVFEADLDHGTTNNSG